MHWNHTLLLFTAALVAGGLNAVAGGGSFLTFPSLIFTGVPPIPANATNTVALWPGAVASIFGFRQQYRGVEFKLLAEFIAVSFVGGAVGAQLLLHTPQHTFSKMIPWLMLAATLIFTFGRKAIRATRGEQGHHMSRPLALLLQLVVSVYGGFFGAGMGILMLAILTIMGYEHIHKMNALTSIFATAVNGVALVTFIVARIVWWPQALLMLLGAVIGGYWSAHYSQKVDPKYVRAFVILVGSSMTTYFFWKYF